MTVAIVFFLWRHFTNLQAKDEADEKSWLEKEKNDLMEKMSAAKKAGASSRELMEYQLALKRL